MKFFILGGTGKIFLCLVKNSQLDSITFLGALNNENKYKGTAERTIDNSNSTANGQQKTCPVL